MMSSVFTRRLHDNSHVVKAVVLWVLFMACAGALTQMYNVQMPGSSAGMHRWEMTPPRWLYLCAGLAFLAWNHSSINGRPSDFFVLFYGGIVVNSFLVFHSVAEPLPLSVIGLATIGLMLPLIVLQALKSVNLPFNFKGLIEDKYVEGLIVFLLVSVIAASYLRAPMSAGLSLSEAYVRRLEARELYPGGSLLAYGLAMSMNGFTPYLAFKAALKMRIGLIAMSVAASIFFFWLIGVKAPFLYLAVALALGVLVRHKKMGLMAYAFVAGVLVLYLVVLLDAYWFNGRSIADHFFMRTFASHAEVQGFYLKFLSGEKVVDWSWVGPLKVPSPPKAVEWSWATGLADSNLALSYFIGEHYAGNPASNSNTSAFLYQLSARGLLGYAVAVIFVPFFLVLNDHLWRTTFNPSYLFIGFLYGLLVVEQAFTVAMVSSGVGVLFVLTVLERSGQVGGVQSVNWFPKRGS